MRLLSLPGVSVLPDGWLEVNVPLSWDATTNHVTAVPPGVHDPGVAHQRLRSAACSMSSVCDSVTMIRAAAAACVMI